MPTERIEYLIELHFSNTITDAEKEELASLVAELSDDHIHLLLETAWLKHTSGVAMPDDISKNIIESILKEETDDEFHHPTPVRKLSNNTRVLRIAVAAACIVIAVTVAWLTMAEEKQPALAKKEIQTPRTLEDVKPGGQKAVLILADGSQVVLDSAANGVLAQQGNAQVIKKGDGSILYAVKGSSGTETLYNTISTPAGGIYQLTLPDGTKAWLNSASSIRYPTEFVTGERRVQISGEVYFEVAKDASKPFIVKINPLAEVKVLGTHFNVNAYDDEADIKTTLLEGSVNISMGNSKSLLTPGQQARINKKGLITRFNDVDLDEAIAWKDGNFLFNSADLPQILRQVARWYNLEIVYEGKIPEDKFSGRVSRAVSLSNFLKWMQWSDVHFRLEGEKLIIKS